ncbi:F-box domain [Dillenia turbinata]|uniref:F-box domain n=1 Tax=Dillenia turbinata TaxID=194707 RepID=A0AAN8U9K9_9MAGN
MAEKEEKYMKKRKKKRKKKRGESKWAGMPRDLLVFIARRLCLSDQIRFCAVCKNWRITPMEEIRSPDGKPPCLVDYSCQYDGNRVVIKCSILPPRCQSAKKFLYAIKRDDGHKFVGSEARSSKHGWLFCTKLNEDHTLPFLFNPFRKDIIVLPDLDPLEDSGFLSVVTSSSPSSPSCVFFAVYASFPYHIIATCGKGDEDWKLYRFFTSTVISQIVCVQSTLYCLSVDGMLIAFSTKDCNGTVVVNPLLLSQLTFDYNFVHTHLFDHNGEILLATADFDISGLIFKDWKVFRIDRSQGCWVKAERIGCLTLFPSPFKSNSIAVSGLGEGMENRLFYMNGIEGSVFTKHLKDGRCRPCPEIYHIETSFYGKIWL